jgi:hypothetical protein
MKHRFVVRTLSAIALVAGVGVTTLTSAASAAVPQYGIGFTKGCVSPTLIGAPYQCSYTIQNTIDTVFDTLTITNMSDVVHAAAGDAASPANFFALLHFDVLAGSPVCTGGTGTGTIADPWIGVTSCSLPAGSKLETDTISYYTVVAGDFAVSPLADEATLNWANVCDGTGGTSCSTLPQHATTTSQSVINKNPSNTVTAIKQGGQTVTSVLSGTSVTDQATVSGSAGTPTGTVTFTFFTSGNCTTGGAAGSPVTLSGGVATSASQGPLGAGSYSFQATYNGNGTYDVSTGACEPLTVTANFTANLTPGFWKNHQAATFALLPLWLGNYHVTTFADARVIMSGMGCGSVGALNCMAGMLLAAELNLAQGGSTCILPVVAQANALLVAHGYHGFSTTPYVLSASDKALAMSLHDLLSAYNIDGVPTC